jgi:hypothetical protein
MDGFGAAYLANLPANLSAQIVPRAARRLRAQWQGPPAVHLMTRRWPAGLTTWSSSAIILAGSRLQGVTLLMTAFLAAFLLGLVSLFTGILFMSFLPALPPRVVRRAKPLRLNWLKVSLRPEDYRLGGYFATGATLFVVAPFIACYVETVQNGFPPAQDFFWRLALVIGALFALFLAALTITQFSSDLALAWFKARRGLVVVEQAACRYVARLFSPLVLPASAELTGRPASPPSTLLLIRGRYCVAALFRTSGVSRLFALTTVLQIRFA